MSTRDNYNKTLRFSVETDEKLGKLAQKFGYSKFQFFNRMVDYFYRTRKDPADFNDTVLKNTLAKNHDTYTSFIKAQEKVLLIPMNGNIDKMIRNQEQIVKFFNEQVLHANKTLIKNQQVQMEKFNETDNVLKSIQQQLHAKKILKDKFLYILDTYIRNRENIGAFKSKDKEDLVAQARKQVLDL